ncbi:MAG: hydroxymethylbilane synthase [Cardiobacteriaceae bacterium]|nr:hydroxymethylbilane synthase [Cardiobacteriaceae bacterium]
MNTPRQIRIATRESRLALWQAEHVAARLRARYPEIEVNLVPMTTQGDQILNTPLAQIGGKGLFIKELEVAMQEGRADIAVHSMKDVGVHFPDGFALAAILARANPFDAFVSNDYAHFADLPHGARVGTCSLRRRMQIAAARPDIELLDLRGNVQTRLAKLDRGDFDAIILACAGLERLGLNDRIREMLPAALSLPAIGQGAIGIECREDSPVFALVAALNDEETALCVKTERIINERLEGSCQVPIAAFATLNAGTLRLQARIGLPDGSRMLEENGEVPRGQAAELAHQLVDRLIARGALDILAALLA